MTALLEIPGLRVPTSAPSARQGDVAWWVISYGLGVDSTAILLRLCELLDALAADHTGPDSTGRALLRAGFPPGFDLSRLLVITAMTGSEWPVHRRLVEQHVLPRLARHGIRYVQVARGGPRKAHGIRILDDSRTPSRLYVDGDYRLFTEMVTAGTIPQLGGARKCSQKAKGVPADEAIALITGSAPYFQVMGFEVDETARCVKDSKEGPEQRTAVYPLVNWGWTRATCESYIHEITNVWWPKSACTFCPFALANKAGRARVLDAFATDPAVAWEPLIMETVAQGLNPTQTLMAGESLHDLMARSTGQGEALALFDERVHAGLWALVEVRRAITGRAQAARALTVLGQGSRSECDAALAEVARRAGMRVERSSIWHSRVWLRRRAAGVFPTAEHLAVVVPATVADKTGPGFPKAWARVEATTTARIPVQGSLLELAG